MGPTENRETAGKGEEGGSPSSGRGVRWGCGVAAARRGGESCHSTSSPKYKTRSCQLPPLPFCPLGHYCAKKSPDTRELTGPNGPVWPRPHPGGCQRALSPSGGRCPVSGFSHCLGSAPRGRRGRGLGFDSRASLQRCCAAQLKNSCEFRILLHRTDYICISTW